MKFKYLFLKNGLANSIKLSTKHAWVKGIHVLSNEGLRPFYKEDTCNNEIVEIHKQNLRSIISRTSGPISTKHGRNHP